VFSSSLKDRTRFEKRLDAVRTEFAANTRVLEPAERRLLIVQKPVDRHAAYQELGSHAAGAPYIGAVHVGVQAKARFVGDPDCVFVVVVR
jgi:hypothetical protein